MFSPSFLRAFNSLFCLIPSKPSSTIIDSINQVYSFFILSNLFFNYFFVCIRLVFSSYLNDIFFQPVLVKISNDLFLAYISPLHISMRWFTLTSHQSTLSAILQPSKKKFSFNSVPIMQQVVYHSFFTNQAC